MLSISVKAAYGRKWRSRSEALADLKGGKDVLCFSGGYATLVELMKQGYTHAEMRQGQNIVAYVDLVELNGVAVPKVTAPKAELFPKNHEVITEAAARQACQDAKNLRRELADISAKLTALDKARRLATFNLQIAEQRVALWEAQETEVKKLGPKGHGRYKESAQLREWELENRLRVALGLKPLEAGQEGLK